MQMGEAHKIQASGRLSGQRALVLGAGSGIGRAVAEAFVQEGAHVVALELSPDKCAALSDELPTVQAIEGNACKRADIDNAVDACAQAGAIGLDALVNCVGIFDFYRGLSEIDADKLEAGFDDIYRVNVLSGLVAVKACLPMLRAARGTVILTSSSSGFYPGRGGILYVSSKFAIRGCVTALAYELAPDVRVNGVAPGGVLGTDIRGSHALGLDNMIIGEGKDRVADLKALTPLQVAMTPQEIAQSYVFLASSAASGITGEFLHPDGGLGIRG